MLRPLLRKYISYKRCTSVPGSPHWIARTKDEFMTTVSFAIFRPMQKFVCRVEVYAESTYRFGKQPFYFHIDSR